MEAQHRANTILQRSRAIFDVAGFGYALLTSPDSSHLVAQHAFELNERGLRITPRVAATDFEAGISRKVTVDQAVGDGAALAMLELVFQKMISDSADAVKTYARAIGEWDQLKKQDWFAFASHLRNAYSHNGLWHFEKQAILPVQWRRFHIDRGMQGQPAAGFIPFFDGTQLVSQMTLYVQGIVDYAQQHIQTGGISSNTQPPS